MEKLLELESKKDIYEKSELRKAFKDLSGNDFQHGNTEFS